MLEIGQTRLMSNGCPVEVMRVGPQRTPGGQWLVELWDSQARCRLLRAYGTVNSYPVVP